jgi:hypothetical protein
LYTNKKNPYENAAKNPYTVAFVFDDIMKKLHEHIFKETFGAKWWYYRLEF